MNIRYISISGNTRSFVQRLTTYAEEQHQHNEKNPTITFKEISENSPLEVETEPFFTFVPTYLDGGDGINNVIALAWWAAAIKTLTTNTA